MGRKIKRVSRKVKLKHAMADGWIYIVHAALLTAAAIIMAFCMIDYENMNKKYLGMPLLTFPIVLIITSSLLHKLRWDFRHPIYCVNCKKRYTKKGFLSTEGLCSYCESGMFVYTKEIRNVYNNRYEGNVRVKRLKGETLIQMLGGK